MTVKLFYPYHCAVLYMYILLYHQKVGLNNRTLSSNLKCIRFQGIWRFTYRSPKFVKGLQMNVTENKCVNICFYWKCHFFSYVQSGFFWGGGLLVYDLKTFKRTTKEHSTYEIQLRLTLLRECLNFIAFEWFRTLSKD